MKRILLSVFAAAMTAAWVAPAMAADVSFSAQYRLRTEYRNESDFNKNNEDNMDFWGQRVRLTTNVKATDDTSLKITLQDTRYWGASGTAGSANGGPAQTDTGNTLDLHESYVSVNNFVVDGLTLRAGRQELAYGDERLIGANNWNNGGRSFDALKLAYASDAVNVDFILSKLYDNQSGTAPSAANTPGIATQDRDLYGIYGTLKSIPNNTIDLYVLGVRDNSIASYTNASHLYTYGARLKGTASMVDYTAELPIQAGAVDTGGSNNTTTRINAYAFAVKAGVTIPNSPKVRIGAEYDYATGDKDSADNKVGTFNNLFPTNHDKMGLMDLQGWKNMKAWNLNASMEPTDKLKVALSYWNFKLADKHDAWYNAAGTAKYTPTGGSNPSFGNGSVGSEVDFTAAYKYNSTVTFEAGLARFFAGKLIKDQVNGATGDNVSDQDWAYLMMTANF